MTDIENRDIGWLKDLRAAHRGLFTPGSMREENTLPAIEAAINRGYAIEIDVQISSDSEIIVFHDFTLDRLTNGEGNIRNLSFEEIRKYHVGKTGLPAPSLKETLDIVNGQSPLFIEIKSRRDLDIKAICEGVKSTLKGYEGHAAIMSFDPRIVGWFHEHAPEVIRGWVMSKEALRGMKAYLLRLYSLRKIAPDFIACDIRELPNPFTTQWKENGKPLLTWTVRTPEHEVTGLKYTDGLIFEAPAVIGADI